MVRSMRDKRAGGDSVQDSEPGPGWAHLARRAAQAMLQERRLKNLNPPQQRQGILEPFLSPLSRSKQKAAIVDLEKWIRLHLIDAGLGQSLRDQLLGVEVVTIVSPELKGRRTKGRSTAPGIDLACEAADLLIANGKPVKTACKFVATKMREYWKAVGATHAEIGDLYPRLDRKIYDARRAPEM